MCQDKRLCLFKRRKRLCADFVEFNHVCDEWEEKRQ
nr:MAG TPA: hypothetical protein [Caudoviricetes sp.]